MEFWFYIIMTFVAFIIIELFFRSIVLSVNKKFQWLIIDKIADLLNEHGILAFESQAKDAYYIKKFESKLEIMKKNFDVLEQRIVKSEYPVNVPKRYYLILQRM